jgi:hypothetical protein
MKFFLDGGYIPAVNVFNDIIEQSLSVDLA